MKVLWTMLIMAMVATVVATAATLRVDYNPRANFGAKIRVDGRSMGVPGASADFYIIGSDDDTDDGDNIASNSPQTRDGIMRPLDRRYREPELPYSFTLRTDSGDPTRLNFDISVGPAAYDFTSISFPLDLRMQEFVFYRMKGGGGPARYSQLPLLYTAPGGMKVYGKVFPVGTTTPNWGEIIGPSYTARVTVTSCSRPLSLAFVNSPSLDTGVRNVEFGLLGGLPRGQRASVSGHIKFSATDPSLFAQTLTYQSESHGHHQSGRRDSDGWSVRVGDPAGTFPVYGPYTTDVLPGNRRATYRLMLDNTSADNNRILTIDVFDAATGQVLKKRDIKRREFTAGPFRYQDFQLDFTANEGQKLEFRTFWHGGSYVRQDYVRVQ